LSNINKRGHCDWCGNLRRLDACTGGWYCRQCQDPTGHRNRRFVAALVLLVVAYAAAVVTTWMVGNSVAVFVILPLYAILLAVFYGPFGWSINGSVGYTRSSVEATPTDEHGRH